MTTLYLHVTENGLDVINEGDEAAFKHHAYLKTQCDRVRMFVVTGEKAGAWKTADYFADRLAAYRPVGRKAMTHCADAFGVTIQLR